MRPNADPHCPRYRTRTFEVSDPHPRPRTVCFLRKKTLTITFGVRGRIAAHVSRIRYALSVTPLPEFLCAQCSPLTGEYVFDFAVVVFGVRLLPPHGFHARAKINIYGPFSGPAPSSGGVQHDAASIYAHTHCHRHIASVLCNVRRSYSRLTPVMIDRMHAHTHINI